jgi:trk system potassium uptake protein TrkH
MVRKKKFRLSTTQIILLSFLVTVLAGIVLLALQISSAIGKAVRYLDALLTATTVTCVTALVTLPTASTWNIR